MTALLDTSSHYTLMKLSVVGECNLQIERKSKALYGIGSVTVPSVKALGETNATITVDGIEAGPVGILVVYAGSCAMLDMIIGRNWLDLQTITYRKENGRFILYKTMDDLELGDSSVMVTTIEVDTLEIILASPKDNVRW